MYYGTTQIHQRVIVNVVTTTGSARSHSSIPEQQELWYAILVTESCWSPCPARLKRT